jgi:cell fate (sporulation/competence/biofilm development) regulator YmcA (YheA/YmcA/DUF963 family)|tara:strand:+ start:2043 stop:2213 length:171 start_codon:yes stop_codon:yes gene_type:complete
MRNKQLFQKRLEQLDATITAIQNGIQMGATISEFRKLTTKASDIVAELEAYVENEN